MNKISTPAPRTHSGTPGRRIPEPKPSTLAFIRQFARCYHYIKQMPAPMSELIVN